MGEIAEMYNEYYDIFEEEEPPEVKCKFCGRAGLEWCEIKGRWVLYDCDGHIHNCLKINADDLARNWK